MLHYVIPVVPLADGWRTKRQYRLSCLKLLSLGLFMHVINSTQEEHLQHKEKGIGTYLLAAGTKIVIQNRKNVAVLILNRFNMFLSVILNNEFNIDYKIFKEVPATSHNRLENNRQRRHLPFISYDLKRKTCTARSEADRWRPTALPL